MTLTTIEIIALLTLLVTVVGLMTGVLRYVLRQNNQRSAERHDEYRTEINSIGEAFRTGLDTITVEHKADMRQLAEDNRSTYQDLSTQIHQRISEQGQATHQFQLEVAKHYPQRAEMNDKIASAVEPVVREIQGVHQQLTELNQSIRDVLQERNK